MKTKSAGECVNLSNRNKGQSFAIPTRCTNNPVSKFKAWRVEISSGKPNIFQTNRWHQVDAIPNPARPCAHKLSTYQRNEKFPRVLLSLSSNALGYSTFRCNPDLGVLQIGIRAKVIENQQSCLLHHPLSPTLPSTPTLSLAEPSGSDDEEVSEGGIPRVIVYGYDGLPIQPVASPSPDYIPYPEDPQTPPVPQDEDEREPMFVQAYDPDYVSEPVYPEYIPLEDEHVFLVEEQPLPPVDLPTAESPRYITESDPEKDPEEYEDDETEDGPVDYPMDGGDDGDDDDGDSSRDDADDEDEDDDDEEEEEHLALADFTIVVPTDEPVSPLEGTEPAIPPPSTDITIGARITVRPQVSISLPQEAEVERLLAMTTPSPSPPISLSPPSAGERLARDDVPESELPPRKRLCLSTLGSRYEIGESSTARPTGGRGVDYGFVSTETVWIVEEEAYASREAWAHSIGESDRRRQAHMTETLRVMRDMRREMSDMQAELLAHREQQRRARQPGPDARISDHQDASGNADSHI
ncbi:hypothetical protein Tco_0369520 [Tanacetum coccineum]